MGHAYGGPLGLQLRGGAQLELVREAAPHHRQQRGGARGGELPHPPLEAARLGGDGGGRRGGEARERGGARQGAWRGGAGRGGAGRGGGGREQVVSHEERGVLAQPHTQPLGHHHRRRHEQSRRRRRRRRRRRPGRPGRPGRRPGRPGRRPGRRRLLGSLPGVAGEGQEGTRAVHAAPDLVEHHRHAAPRRRRLQRRRRARLQRGEARKVLLRLEHHRHHRRLARVVPRKGRLDLRGARVRREVRRLEVAQRLPPRVRAEDR